MDKILVSSDYAIATRKYILNKYNLLDKKGIYQSYKRIYTLNDKVAFYNHNSHFLLSSPEVLYKRLNNFLILSMLKGCNDKETFDEILPVYGSIRQGVFFLNIVDIYNLIMAAPDDSVFSPADELVDCIMVTINKDRDMQLEVITDYFCLRIS